MIVDLSIYPCISINFDSIYLQSCTKHIKFLVVLTSWHTETFIIVIIKKNLWRGFLHGILFSV